MNVAIFQLASWGDVIISTCLTRAIKQHHPDWHITYFTGSIYADALKNNPDIDKIEPIKVASKTDAFNVWGHVTKANQAKFDKTITPWPGILPMKDWRLLNNHHGHNNFMWAYPRAIQALGLPFSGSIKSYLYHTVDELSKIHQFVGSLEKRTMIMMEISGHSCQTHWNHTWTTKTIQLLVTKLKRFHLFISNGGPEPEYLTGLKKKFNSSDITIHYLNHFSIREMSALFNHCDIMFSVSSGTANACMTHQCKRTIKWFELVNANHWDSTPMWVGPDKLIYMINDPDKYLSLVNQRL